MKKFITFLLAGLIFSLGALALPSTQMLSSSKTGFMAYHAPPFAMITEKSTVRQGYDDHVLKWTANADNIYNIADNTTSANTAETSEAINQPDAKDITGYRADQSRIRSGPNENDESYQMNREKANKTDLLPDIRRL